ncbi:MAG: hypothetical protein D6785_03775, partial [Planctomycetota bacterium]
LNYSRCALLEGKARNLYTISWIQNLSWILFKRNDFCFIRANLLKSVVYKLLFKLFCKDWILNFFCGPSLPHHHLLDNKAPLQRFFLFPAPKSRLETYNKKEFFLFEPH